MKLVMFSKALKDLDIPQMIARAHELGLEGYDLAVRPGYAVNPDNAGTALPGAAAEFTKEGLCIPIITARGDMTDPAAGDVKPLLAAMDKAGVRLLKLGYYKYKLQPAFDYWAEAARIRKLFEQWARLGKEYNVRIVYHTHSSDPGNNDYLGCNASNLMHLLRGLDPGGIGAYLDTGHLAAEGERFSHATAIVGEYLQAVALKDMLAEWDRKNDCLSKRWVTAGQGQVDWKVVFVELARRNFQGPLSIHCEYECATNEEFNAQLPVEIAFFAKKKAESISLQK